MQSYLDHMCALRLFTSIYILYCVCCTYSRLDLALGICQERKRISMVAIDVGLAKEEKGIDAVGLVHNKRPLLIC